MNIEYECPVNGCEKTFESAQGVQGHVAGKAPHEEQHRSFRDSLDHDLETYFNETYQPTDDGYSRVDRPYR